jgi:hypothetical protein
VVARGKVKPVLALPAGQEEVVGIVAQAQVLMAMPVILQAHLQVREMLEETVVDLRI